MEFIRRQNIARYRQMLECECDERKRGIVQALLNEELAREEMSPFPKSPSPGPDSTRAPGET